MKRLLLKLGRSIARFLTELALNGVFGIGALFGLTVIMLITMPLFKPLIGPHGFMPLSENGGMIFFGIVYIPLFLPLYWRCADLSSTITEQVFNKDEGEEHNDEQS